MDDLRYLQDESKFLNFAYDVFKNYFKNRNSFNAFYNNINSPKLKNKFLKIASTYKFLVVDGHYINENNSYDKYIYYLDHTNKFIAIFAMIENLYSEDDYKEFYEWLKSKKTKTTFPIENAQMLESLHENYLTVHGSTLKIVKFFNSLSPEIKSLILNKFKEFSNKKNKYATEDEVFISTAKSFYKIRNDYVHRANLVNQFSEISVLHRINKKIFLNNLDFDDLKKIFENGFLVYFHFNEYDEN